MSANPNCSTARRLLLHVLLVLLLVLVLVVLVVLVLGRAMPLAC